MIFHVGSSLETKTFRVEAQRLIWC